MECLTLPTTHPLSSPSPKTLNRTKTHSSPRRSRTIVVAAQQQQDPNSDPQQQQQLDLSVLRFTLGIPGVDESYLPRWIGATFGSLVIANHLFSPSSPTPSQLRSEALGICLAAFSTVLPYLGGLLKGANAVDRTFLPEGNKQIFALSPNLSDMQEEDLAWGSYVILRSTNTISVAIVIRNALCIRGYWNTPEDFSKSEILEWFKSQIQQLGFWDLKDALYFPQSPDSRLDGILPKGVLSVLVQPVCAGTNVEGFVVLASNVKYAYSSRDRAWIRAIANKFLLDGMETNQ